MDVKSEESPQMKTLNSFVVPARIPVVGDGDYGGLCVIQCDESLFLQSKNGQPIRAIVH